MIRRVPSALCLAACLAACAQPGNTPPGTGTATSTATPTVTGAAATPGTPSAFDGTYRGTIALTMNRGTGCRGTGSDPYVLRVRNGVATGGWFGGNFSNQVAPDGSFSAGTGIGARITGKFDGNHFTGGSTSRFCEYSLDLTRG